MQSPSTNVQFSFVRELGFGTYGEVSLVQEATSGTYYAQKLIRVRDYQDPRAIKQVADEVDKEVEIMKEKLRHHHIASVLFNVREGATFRLIMLPVADCDLRRYLELQCDRVDLSRDEANKYGDNWFGCLVSALAYVHEQQIKHEDIKPKNILIKHNRPYLSDFGSAIDFSRLEASTSPDHATAGTPIYWPPENTSRGRPADIFALGCVFSEMLTVRQRYTLAEYREARFVHNTDFGNAFRKNLGGVRRWLNRLPRLESRDAILPILKETIADMIEEQPNDRPKARQIKRKFRVEEDLLFCSACC